MRRASFTGISSGGGPNEPLIVVEESDGIAEEDEEESKPSPPETSNVNNYLLTPWRDTRKRSLPTPSCTSGITASQVRRLSERGGEGSGPSPLEQAFLATLSQVPVPVPGTRRHSVVTISKAPHLPPLFGRNRRESIAAFASGTSGLPLRRESVGNQSRGSLTSIGNTGSSFNLHLDIMDDITEAKARAKEKRKMSRTTSKDLTDESESGASKTFDGNCCRTKKPESPETSEVASKKTGPGIVCTNTDLISILSPLTSSAQEICAAADGEKDVANAGSPTRHDSILDRKRKLFKDRSNSFDVGILPGSGSGHASWFVKRHQPIAKKDEIESEKSQIVVTFTDERRKVQSSLVAKPERSKNVKATSESKKAPATPEMSSKVVWDNRSGSVVDPHLFGSAIEVFLNRKTGQESRSTTQINESPTSAVSKSWFEPENAEPAGESGSDACDTSICSTLKDLFVK